MIETVETWTLNDDVIVTIIHLRTPRAAGNSFFQYTRCAAKLAGGSPPRKADLDPAAPHPRSGINEIGRTVSARSTDRIRIEVRPHSGKIVRAVIMIVVAMRSALDRSRAGRSEDAEAKKRCWQLGLFANGMRHDKLQGFARS